ncbi:MAG: VOC family protein [Oscillospiraceae bacterium]|jgi:lactoylglutathione lyase|nr:VOC family protein [Oscillospiraceae bacterium]
MKFAHVTISVIDLDKSISFYRDIVGLPLQSRTPAGPDTEIAFLGDGGTKVELICRKGESSVFFSQDISIGFETDSVTELSALLKANGYETGEIISPNPQVAFFFISDPNAVKVQFLEHKSV